jgi:predicted nucleic acid-binding protein
VRYLLDSTLLIDHANRDQPAMELLLDLHSGPNELYICDVVTCEVLSQGDDDHLRHLGVLLQALEYVSITPETAQKAGAARRQRHQEGGKLGLGDALISALAADLKAVVVTRNRSDFERQGIDVLSY